MTNSIKVTRYIVQFDPVLKGWIAFKVVTENNKIVDKTALTVAKPAPNLAARSLYRYLTLEQQHDE
jgi:hypothetical protein